MATKSFLKKEHLKEALKVLGEPSQVPRGDELSGMSFPNSEFSAWLSERLETELSKASPYWLEAAPVALGSWARGELCPRSDIDLLFCGEEKSVSSLVEDLQGQGFRIRYRVPANPTDWSEGVGPFDWVAILQGKAFTPLAHEKLLAQQAQLRNQGRKFANRVLQDLLKERRERQQRYDSISNFLEPNLKFGAGGLRDIQQAFYVLDLFYDKFHEAEDMLLVLNYYKNFFLSLRQKIHLLGANDILVAHLQGEVSDWLGYETQQQFMREVQKGLSRSSFYTGWIFEFAKSTKSKKEKIESRKLRTVNDAFEALKENSSALMQYRVRRQMDLIFETQKPSLKTIGRCLEKHLSPGVDDKFVLSLFRSRLIDKCLPNLRMQVGLVQHNQYHRYTADIHVQQCLRTLVRLYRPSKKKDPIARLVRQLDEKDWKILVWTCLYHDIGKGRKGDHSVVGARIAEKDLSAMGVSRKVIDEVVWMVRHHLVLSVAAFRKNPNEKKTWEELHGIGLQGKRIPRLALFTAIDIQATNPEAWNSWKQKLLLDLVAALEEPEAVSYLTFLNLLKKKKGISREFISGLDTALIHHLSQKVIFEDYARLKKRKGKSLSTLIVGNGAEKWVRFHENKDSSGLFVQFVQNLFSAGVSIRQAFVQTYSKYGVYDWFLIKTNRTQSQLQRLLQHSVDSPKMPKPVFFTAIRKISIEGDELIISFTGKDQSGALVTAARALYEQDFEINWASVHTWGRMLEDVFSVNLVEDYEQRLNSIRERFITPKSNKSL